MAARDVIMIGAFVFAIAIALFVTHNMMTKTINQMINQTVINQSVPTVTELNNIKTNTLTRLDYVVFGVFIALTLALIITGWLIGGNILFMFLYFIFIVFGIILGAVLSNAWEQVSQSSIFGTTVSAFPLANNILSNLPIYLAAIGFIGLIVMFAKPMVAGQNE